MKLFTLEGFLQVGQVRLNSAFLIARASEDLAGRVRQKYRGVAFDFVFFGQGFVCLLELRRLLRLAREVELDEDKVLFDGLEKFIFPKDFVLEHDAEVTPVRTGEIDQDGFVLLLGNFLGFFQIGQPSVSASKSGEGE